MDVTKKVLLAYLEEDNEQKVFFRLLPLLDQDGSIREESIALWPAEGGLRIVPDRNEQFHFKDRMRTLGSFCLVDLTPFLPEANKIRTNKNFNPERGEVNQYIIYSDTIKALPEDLVYEVIEGDPSDLSAALSQLATPQGYLKAADAIYGPLAKNATELGSPSSELDKARLFTQACPDGKDRTFFWPLAAPAIETTETEPAVDETKAGSTVQEAEESLEIGKPLAILDESKTFEDHLKDIAQPLSTHANLLNTPKTPDTVTNEPAPQLTGTPLYRSSSSKPAATRVHNPLHEVVESQWKAAKYEAPSAQLKQGASLRHVENPVDVCREALQSAWSNESAQDQVLDCILALPGMSRRIEKALLKAAGDHPLQEAVKLEMQSLEAERLALLVQLDKAKEDVIAYRENALAQITKVNKDRLTDAEKAVSDVENHLKNLKAELNALKDQRDALEHTIHEWQSKTLPAAIAAAMAEARYLAPMIHAPTVLTLPSGDAIPLETLIQSLMDALGFTHDDAVNWLVLLAQCPRIQINAAKTGDALTFLKRLAQALGWGDCLVFQEMPEQRLLINGQAPSPAPALLATPYLQPLNSDPQARTLLLADSAKTYVHSHAYKAAPWPLITLNAIPLNWEPAKAARALPAAFSVISALAITDAALAQPEAAFMENLYAACAPIKTAPSSAAFQLIANYLKSAAPLMEGGFSAACDYACRQWLLPLAVDNPELTQTLKQVLVGLPCAEELNK